MNIEKYYNVQKDGLYCVHFANRTGLSIEEITEIFSNYGNVVGVNMSGDLHGLRFVKYRTLDEIKSCLEGLESNKTINILPQKPKLNQYKKSKEHWNGKEKTESLSPKNHMNRDKNYGKAENQLRKSKSVLSEFNESFDSDVHKELQSNYTENDGPTGYDEMSKRVTELYAWRNDSRSQPDDCQSNVSKSSERSFKMDRNHIVPNDARVSPIEKNMTQLEKLQKLRGIAANTFTLPTNLIATNKDIKACVEDDHIPDLVSQGTYSKSDLAQSNGIVSNNTNSCIIPAHEVIVANVHLNYGIHYILHLFEKHEPISVSLMEIIPKTAIRYCRVFFKTAREAVDIEKKFDNHILSGSHLIVLRPSKLIEEACMH